MQQGYTNADKDNARDKEFDRLRTRGYHLQLEGQRTGDIVGVSESCMGGVGVGDWQRGAAAERRKEEGIADCD